MERSGEQRRVPEGETARASCLGSIQRPSFLKKVQFSVHRKLVSWTTYTESFTRAKSIMHAPGFPPDVAGNHHESHNVDVVHHIHHVHHGPFQGGSIHERGSGTTVIAGQSVRQQRSSLICFHVFGVILMTVTAFLLFSGIGLLFAGVSRIPAFICFGLGAGLCLTGVGLLSTVCLCKSLKKLPGHQEQGQSENVCTSGEQLANNSNFVQSSGQAQINQSSGNGDFSQPPNCAACGQPPNCAAYGQPLNSAAYGQPLNSAAYGQPLNSAAYGQPPNSAAYGQPPNSAAYGQPSNSAAYGQPPNSAAYGQPPYSAAYGQPPNISAYSLPPNSAAYGQQPNSAAYGQPLNGATCCQPPKSAAFGQPPKSAAYGQPPKSAAYGQPPKSAAYGQQPNSAAYGQPLNSAAYGQPPGNAQPSRHFSSAPLPDSTPPPYSETTKV